ncbi:MAG: SUMF1/EgtB/PvdO family nonheme iron enzyme [Byssovorax sp.]
MSRRLSLLASLALAAGACGDRVLPPSAPPKPPPHQEIVPPFPGPGAPTPSASAAAEAPKVCPARDPALTRKAGGPWVVFYGPDYDGNDGPVNGPSFWFDTPGLPALSRDGQRVLFFARDTSLGATPNLTLLTERIADGKVLSTASLLDAAAYAGAHDGPTDLDGQKRAFAALRDKVEGEIVRLNEQLTRDAWRPLGECRVDIGAGETQPSCAMQDQQIQCGSAVRAVYREPDLDISLRGKSLVHQHDPKLRAPPQRGGGDPPVEVEVRGCVGAAWMEPASGLMLLLVQHACHGAGGDWCSVADQWHLVKLPRAPGPAPAPSPPPATCPAGMTAIPAGTFTMGSASGRPDERPPHPVQVGAFCLDTTEVTVAAYRACLKSGRCFTPAPSRWSGPGAWARVPGADCNFGVAGRDDHPMNCVPYAFAEEYCEAMGKRLPTEAEWEMAARGAEGRTFPWGEGVPDQGVCWNAPLGTTCPAGKSPVDRTPLGVLDLGGNLREWTKTTFVSYDGCFPEQGMAVRGGAFADQLTPELRASRRASTQAGAHTSDLGFRCAGSLSP